MAVAEEEDTNGLFFLNCPLALTNCVRQENERFESKHVECESTIQQDTCMFSVTVIRTTTVLTAVLFDHIFVSMYVMLVYMFGIVAFSEVLFEDCFNTEYVYIFEILEILCSWGWMVGTHKLVVSCKKTTPCPPHLFGDPSYSCYRA